MKARIPAPAIALVVLTVVAALGDVAVSLANGKALDPSAIGIISFLAFPAMGLVILRHHPRHVIGWLLLGIGVDVYLIFGAADLAALVVRRYPGLLGLGHALAWISGWIWIPFFLMVALFTPMLFPDGRLLSRRWRVVLLSGFVFAALAFFGNAFSPGVINSSYPDLKNPLALPQWQPLFKTLVDASVPFALFAMLGSLTSVVVRYRRGDTLQRQQLRWFLLAVIVTLVPFVAQGNVPDRVATVLIVVLVPFLPISIAIAVLRHRLYDIDVVINRALVYGSLAVFISAVYVGIVVGIGALLRAGNRPNIALSILATAVVAVAFQPVRERVQRFANRLVYGKRATPYEVMAGFADRMAGTLSGDEVLPRMAEAAARGVGAQAARVALLLPDGVRRTTIWPETAGDAGFPHVLPVVYQGETIGEIAVRKGPGEAITPSEQRLLSDLAAQAGLVLHNLRLTAQLQARLKDLSAQATELRASRNRILSAQESERRRLGAELQGGVQRELESIAEQVGVAEQLLADDAERAAILLERLTGETQRTLDSLREMARGIFPPLLADRGIVAAVEAHIRKAGIEARVEVAPPVAAARFDPGVEAAVYFCCIEALRDAAGPASISLVANDGELAFVIDGLTSLDGRVQSLRDRVESLGGRLATSRTRLSGAIPIRALEPVP